VRIGVLGGTFDPIHAAHVFIGATARHQLRLDRVLYPVAYRPWLKADRALTNAEDRFDMVEAALDGIEGLEASRLEIDRGGTTYTADTVDELLRRHRQAEVFLIVGSDVLADLPTWHRIDDLLRATTLVVATRPGHQAEAPPNAETIDSPLLDLSSTDLRGRLERNEPVDGLVPPAVVRLIRQRGLYAVPG
jgi:nicotinate-nucleotide adenylyltransferase